MDTFGEDSECFQSSEELPETQVCGVGGQFSIESGQRGGLGFDDHMALLQQGRSRYRISNPTLHVNSIASRGEQNISQTVSVESDRPRRVGLRSASTWGGEARLNLILE